MSRELNVLYELIEGQRALHADLRLLLKLLERIFCPRPIHHFHIKEITMQPIAPGFSPVYTATPQPVGNVLNPSQPKPTWTSSDETNAPVTVDSTGLQATVNVPKEAAVGTAFTLTINYTNADGTAATGSIDQTIVAAPPMDITSFTIEQTA